MMMNTGMSITTRLSKSFLQIGRKSTLFSGKAKKNSLEM